MITFTRFFFLVSNRKGLLTKFSTLVVLHLRGNLMRRKNPCGVNFPTFIESQKQRLIALVE
jgi:hypothetical protein